MPTDPLLVALARNALVVTPNKRLAREAVARHDAAQAAAGRRAWPAARAMPWHAFVAELWQQALEAGLALPPHRLDDAQAGLLWRRIVARDLAQPLVDPAAAAVLAAEAWERVHAYGAGGPSWRGFAATGPEVEAFVRWAAAFEAGTRALDALDPARAPDAIAQVAAKLPGAAQRAVVLAGFVERTPQQVRLVEALAAAGADVAWLDDAGPPEAVGGVLHAAATPEEELADAFAWAAAQADAAPQARVAIVVHDLHERRAEVAAHAEEALCPGLQWPGREDLPRPYDLSAGGTLADVPLVATALDLLALAHGPLEAPRAAALLRSRHLPGDARARLRRAALERGWIERGEARWTLEALARALERSGDDLGARWRTAAPRRALPARAAPRAFVDAWRRWLEAAGWCEGVALTPAERDARGAWHDALADFVRLAVVVPQLARDEARATLAEAVARQPFAPESPGARIRVLGLLEAAGMTFDAVWVAGLSAAAWPRAPEPSPLLPIAWQRERGVPRATPERELDYARRLTAQLARSAPRVVYSYAAQVDDHRALPSPLVAQLPGAGRVAPRRSPTARAQFAARPVPERLDDARAPAWPAGAAFRGGAGLIESQSACPFQAAARYRLAAERWPEPVVGLPPAERGRHVHAAMAAFWSAVRSHDALSRLGDAALTAAIDAAVAAAHTAIDPALWALLPPVVAAGEAAQVARQARAWIDAVERARPAFTVEATEARATLVLAGHALDLRIDRVDRLPQGRAVIDYKTGRTVGPRQWFGDRPQATQLALYALALGSDGVAALALARLKPGEAGVDGVARDAQTWPALLLPSALGDAALPDWNAAQAALGRQVAALAAEVHEGVVSITPRDPTVCTHCGLRPLCRIAAVDDDDADAEVAA